MARLLIEGEWYESLSPRAMYEYDFENLIVANASTLYPEYITVDFKPLVKSEYGNGRPDLALVDRDYREWWVVEVEMGDHPLSHVEGQVSIFSAASYGISEAQSLAEANPELDPERLVDLMQGEPPRVFVLVNKPKPDWTTALARYRALVGVAEVFRSQRNRVVLRINGEQPEPPEDVLTWCHRDNVIPNMLVIESPASLGVSVGSEVHIRHEGSLSPWKRIDVANQAWLTPVGRYPLPGNTNQLAVVRDKQGSYEFLPDAKRRRQ